MNIDFREFGKLVVSVLVCHSAGLIGSFFTAPAIGTWYAGLNKPFFTPPSWVFPVVWLTLYTFMGIALYLVWSKGFSRPRVKRAMGLFGVQLGMNALWSVLFFGLKSIVSGFVQIVVLLGLIVFVTLRFYEIDKRTVFFMVPYVVWVGVATALNLGIVLLN